MNENKQFINILANNRNQPEKDDKIAKKFQNRDQSYRRAEDQNT